MIKIMARPTFKTSGFGCTVNFRLCTVIQIYCVLPPWLDTSLRFVSLPINIAARSYCAEVTTSAQREGGGREEEQFLSLPSYPCILRCMRYSEIKIETSRKSNSLLEHAMPAKHCG